jgi:glycosyl hydrolase family 62
MQSVCLRVVAFASGAALVLMGATMNAQTQQADSNDNPSAAGDLLAGRFQWTASAPLVEPLKRPDNPCHAIKDPSVVFHDGRWHLFCSIRSRRPGITVEYLSFADWKDANAAERHVLKAHKERFCAPQVFYFAPQRKWYMICQASDESWDPKYGASYSTSTNIADPASWTKVRLLGAKRVDGEKAGLDFWVICDERKAHLFFTTLDGHMWREETTLEQFPQGWSEPQLAIRGDIFEASHIYALKGTGKYLTMVEAQGGHGWRYFKAYLADALEGPWEPVAATKQKSFASMANVDHPDPRWTDCISHGELIRTGVDQHLEVDPSRLRCVFQGVLDKERSGKNYGEIPWRLGLLEAAGAGE